MTDVALNKSATIERCLRRVRDIYGGDPANLYDDQTRQDAIVLNLQRAAQAAIDLAFHLVRVRRLGNPQESREAFDLLVEAGGLDPGLGSRLRQMVGFRNIAVHDYERLNMDIVRSIIDRHLTDFEAFVRFVLRGGDG